MSDSGVCDEGGFLLRVGEYEALVDKRKKCFACQGLENPSKCGTFDKNQIGPWSLWQGNLRAEVMVVGQDWGDIEYFRKNRGHEAATNPTNEKLRELLAIAGLPIDKPSAEDSGAGSLFFTNAILCLKKGGMQAAVDPEWFKSCGSKFLQPTIELVKPKFVITLGERAYRATCDVYGLRPKAFRNAVEGEPVPLRAGTLLLPVYHCGARILNTHRPMDMQKSDWERIGRILSGKAPE